MAALVAASVLLNLAAVGHAASFLRAGLMSKGDVESSFASEMAGASGEHRLGELEGSMRVTYASLPKNAYGNLGHQAVRYALHRMFVQRHGWFMKGLEPNNDTWHEPSSSASLKEWIPAYLQDLLERRLGERGANLHELSVLAAALEDLVSKEAIERLKTAYQMHRLSATRRISSEQANEVVDTFFVSFLLAGNFSAATPHEATIKKRSFASSYIGWTEAAEWLQGISGHGLKAPEDTGVDFSATSRAVLDIGQQFHTLNDRECRDLKLTLRDMEGRKAGRVRLSTFYNMSFFTHWQFTEKADYLRALGALDESDPKQPSVIIPNYVMARPNCLEVSPLYGICCRNECEDLMGHLEREISEPAADADRIAKLVEALPSDTVSAPRKLSAALRGRLGEVATASRDGKVVLHGRLFAQWMHHAFPRECPYPHEAGTTNPQTPDEWMRETGHTDAQASKEEMQKQVESDTCAFGTAQAGFGKLPGGGCGEQDDGHAAELPWTPTEELLAPPSAPLPSETAGPAEDSSGEGAKSPSRIQRSLLLLTGVVVALVLALRYWHAACRRSAPSSSSSISDGNQEAAQWNAADCWMTVALCLLTAVLYAVNVLDRSAFAFALCGGIAVLAIRVATEPRRPAAACMKEWKCCV